MSEDAKRVAVIAARAWDEGFRAGAEHERAKWYWQAGNRAAMAAAGMPVERPERPANPHHADEIERAAGDGS